MSVVSVSKTPYLPIVTLYKNDASTLVHNHFTSTYELGATMDARIKAATYNAAGHFDLTIGNSELGDLQSVLSDISEGNEVLFEVGKTNATREKVLRGVIETIEIVEPSRNHMELHLSGPDWGSNILQGRISNFYREQKKLSNGEDLDNTDNEVLCEKIAQDLLTETGNYVVPDVTAEDQGVVVIPSNFVSTGIRLVNFACNMEKLWDKLAELAQLSGCTFWIDPDKVIYFKQALVVSSGILLTDNISDSVALAWDQTKVGLISPNTSYVRTLEHHKRRIFGVGGNQTQLIDKSQELTTANQSIDTTYYAIQFDPDKVDCPKIAVYVGKTGTAQGADFFIELKEQHPTDLNPNGSIIRTWSKQKEAINTTAEITADPTLGWHYFQVNDKLNTASKYWIVIRPPNVVSSAGNVFNWYYQSAGSSTSASSTDGATWTPGTRDFAFRQYYSDPVLVIRPGTTLASTTKHLWEEVIRKADITDQEVMSKLIGSEFRFMSGRKEMFKTSIYNPDILLQTGQQVRIRKMASSYAFDYDDFVLGEVEYSFSGSDDQATGAFYTNITATRFEPFA